MVVVVVVVVVVVAGSGAELDEEQAIAVPTKTPNSFIFSKSFLNNYILYQKKILFLVILLTF